MPIRDSKESYNGYMREYHKKRYHLMRDSAIQFLGGRCYYCGSDKELELDHIDPKSKTVEVSRLLSVSKKTFWEEVEKCQVLCRECHNNKTIIERGKVPAKGTHGTISSYRYCKCLLCKKAKSDYNKKHKKPL